MHDFRARFYDPQIGRWHVVDPMIENNYEYTPYAYCYNNPVIFIDPFGLDTLKFNMEGFYLNTSTSDGDPVLEMVREDGSEYFSFNDPEKDLSDLESLIEDYGSSTQLVYLKTKDDVDNYLKESGATDSKNADKSFRYIKNESEGRKLDFWATPLSDEMVNAGMDSRDILNDKGGFVIFEGNQKAYNAMDAGNYLWGAACANLGVSLTLTRIYAQYGALKRHMTLDSKADQRAIISGHIDQK